MTDQPRPPREGLRRSFLRLVYLVARRDYLRTVRRRGFVFGTLLLPLAIGGFIVLSALFSPGIQPQPAMPDVPVALVNESDVQITPPAGSNVRLLDAQAARRQLESGAIREFYLIPSGYPNEPEVRRVAATGRGLALDDLSRRIQQEQLLAKVVRVALLELEDIEPATLDRLVQPFELHDAALDGSEVVAGFEAGFLLPFAFVFLFVMSIFITSGYLLQSVTEEKENRVVEILLSSVPPLPLMAGKIVGLGAAGLTQVAIWVGAVLLALGVMEERVPGTGLQLSVVTTVLAFIYFALGYLCYGAIFAAIGALAPGAREAQSYSGFLGFFALIPLIFAGAFLSDTGSPIVTVLALIPLTAPVAMLEVLTLSPDPPWPLVIASLASLTIFAVLAAVGAARVFRATLLLYGVRPSVRAIVGAITARG